MKTRDKFVSTAASLVIAGSVKYAVARESVRSMNLAEEYQINAQFYGGTPHS